MSKHGLAIMIADKMPPPGKRDTGGDYGGDTGDSTDEEGGGDEEMELSAVADFFKCGKSGDYEGALGHLRDLVSMLSDPGEKDEG